MDFRLKDPKEQSGIVVQAGMLAAASIVVRMIGLLYQAPLTAIIGDEGNGYYSLAYNIYTIILLISSYSIPSAISKIMSQKLALGEYKNAQRIFRVALYYVLCIGGFFSLFVFFGANILVSTNSAPVLRAFAPTIFLFGILGVLRGYFQAYASMIQTSVSQILEQIFNAGMSLLMAFVLITMAAGKSGTEQAINGAIGSAMGTGSGVVVALIFMAYVYRYNRGFIREQCEMDESGSYLSGMVILKEVVRVVTPFILSSFILNLTTTLNQTIYANVMMDAKGLAEAAVSTQYGIFSRKATVITNIPISVATAASAAVIPNISAAFATGDKKETGLRAKNAVLLTALVAIPSAAGLIFLAKPVTMLLYPQRASLDLASRLLALLAITVFFYSMSTISNAVLQSTEHMNLPLVSAVIALVVQTVLLVVMLRGTNLDVYALVFASVIYSVMIFICNEFFIRRDLGKRSSLGHAYVPLLTAALIMGIGAKLVYSLLHLILGMLGLGGLNMTGIGPGGVETGAFAQYLCNLICVVPSILIALVIYGFLLVKLGVLSEELVLHLPKGRSLLKILKKLRFL